MEVSFWFSGRRMLAQWMSVVGAGDGSRGLSLLVHRELACGTGFFTVCLSVFFQFQATQFA